ncbi:hypothetical protein HII28_09665 [Planctomonas sp. JC2975]|uniref:hypothetical protein n=1 Tax=Planctomonas sp. JC2975 TaxID=2729626 RepID=UPI001475691F|nr:hypothetical protein [Planctomonas sp. JC2975]NNC12141.1 hypothetical protein [Planctomonas sp. JC2975]
MSDETNFQGSQVGGGGRHVGGPTDPQVPSPDQPLQPGGPGVPAPDPQEPNPPSPAEPTVPTPEEPTFPTPAEPTIPTGPTPPETPPVPGAPSAPVTPDGPQPVASAESADAGGRGGDERFARGAGSEADLSVLAADVAHPFDQTNGIIDGLEGDADDPDRVEERLSDRDKPAAPGVPPLGVRDGVADHDEDE